MKFRSGTNRVIRNYSIGKTIRFRNGEYETSDEAEIRILKKSHGVEEVHDEPVIEPPPVDDAPN